MDLSVDEQRVIYDYGRQYIYAAIGKYPVAYRAGAYYADDNSLKALAESGFQIDSSLYSNHENSEITNGKRHDQIFRQDGMIEFPIVDVFNGASWRKLDLDWLSYDEIIRTLEYCRASDEFDCVQLMFHSFSFVDMQDDGRRTLFSDGNKNIYGEDTEDKNKLENLLDFLKNQGGVRDHHFQGLLGYEHTRAGICR